MAYCLAFHYHPKQWTMKLVDNLIDAGDQWSVINKIYVETVHRVYNDCKREINDLIFSFLRSCTKVKCNVEYRPSMSNSCYALKQATE